MKIFTQQTSGIFNKSIICILFAAGSALLHSCKQDPIAEPQISYLSMANVSPTPATYNVYADQNKVNTAALPFGGSLPYLQISAGTHRIKFTTASSTESIITKNITLDKDRVYSLFLIDKSPLDFLLVTDQPNIATAEKAFVRFINLSPDAPALDLAVQSESTLITNKAYKASSDYIELDPKTYIFEIKDTATGTTANTTMSSIELKAGKFYTIISRGLLLPSGTDQPFSGQVITN